MQRNIYGIICINCQLLFFFPYCTPLFQAVRTPVTSALHCDACQNIGFVNTYHPRVICPICSFWFLLPWQCMMWMKQYSHSVSLAPFHFIVCHVNVGWKPISSHKHSSGHGLATCLPSGAHTGMNDWSTAHDWQPRLTCNRSMVSWRMFLSWGDIGSQLLYSIYLYPVLSLKILCSLLFSLTHCLLHKFKNFNTKNLLTVLVGMAHLEFKTSLLIHTRFSSVGNSTPTFLNFFREYLGYTMPTPNSALQMTAVKWKCLKSTAKQRTCSKIKYLLNVLCSDFLGRYNLSHSVFFSLCFPLVYFIIGYWSLLYFHFPDRKSVV